MKKGKKAQRRLERRLNGHKELTKKGSEGQYTAPGSRNQGKR